MTANQNSISSETRRVAFLTALESIDRQKEDSDFGAYWTARCLQISISVGLGLIVAAAGWLLLGMGQTAQAMLFVGGILASEISNGFFRLNRMLDVIDRRILMVALASATFSNEEISEAKQ